jgi:opacity protein-like surface antigen
MKKYALILITLMVCHLAVYKSSAQFRFSNLFGQKEKVKKHRLFEPSSSVSFGVGTSSYYGDISPYNRLLQSSINGMRWNLAFNFTRQISPSVGLRFGLTYARISGDDSYMEGVKGYEAYFVRNLHFRNDIKQLSVVAQYDLVKTDRSFLRRAGVIPYIFGGVAVFAHDPLAKTPVDAGATSEWVRLQPLNTEGQGLSGYNSTPYSLVSVSFPLGFGVRYKLSRNWDLGFEMSYQYALTDYLDDVGGKYADLNDLLTQSQGPLSVSMANRTLEPVAANRGINRTQGVTDYLINNNLYVPGSNPFASSIPGFTNRTDSRGNPKYNDAYLLTSFKIIYHIPTQIKCPVIR